LLVRLEATARAAVFRFAALLFTVARVERFFDLAGFRAPRLAAGLTFAIRPPAGRFALRRVPDAVFLRVRVATAASFTSRASAAIKKRAALGAARK